MLKTVHKIIKPGCPFQFLRQLGYLSLKDPRLSVPSSKGVGFIGPLNFNISYHHITFNPETVTSNNPPV
jgi:hypothetical protein